MNRENKEIQKCNLNLQRNVLILIERRKSYLKMDKKIGIVLVLFPIMNSAEQKSSILTLMRI